MTAPQPATPGSDREVPWCNLPFCPAWAQRGEHRIETDRCIVGRPAAPSEPPAADSPTPGTGTCGAVSHWPGVGCQLPPHAHDQHDAETARGSYRWTTIPVAPSPVDTTEPLAIVRETIEDALENDRCGICGSVDHFREDCLTEAQQDVGRCAACGGLLNRLPGEPGWRHVGQRTWDHRATPAETQQDDEIIRAILDRGVPAHAAPFVDFDVIVRELRGLAARPSADAETPRDSWRLAEWQVLPDDQCGISGCDSGETDQRGPVVMRDGSMHKVCPEHWEPIMRLIGEQTSWEKTDGYRAGGSR